jgi:hypothetical protein
LNHRSSKPHQSAEALEDVRLTPGKLGEDKAEYVGRDLGSSVIRGAIEEAAAEAFPRQKTSGSKLIDDIRAITH